MTVSRSPGSIKILLEVGAEHGLDSSACLAGSGLSPTALYDADARVTAAQELDTIRNLIRALPDTPGLGLETGTRYHLTTHGIWGLAVASSPDLGSAIRFGLRYLDLTFAFTRITLRIEGGEAAIVLDDRDVPADLRRFLVEREGASIITLQRDLFSATIPLLRVVTSYPEPPYAELYEPIFGIRAGFGAASNRAVFDAELLDLPLPQANELTLRACEEQCREILSRRRMLTGTADEVREELIRRRGTIPRIDEVARALHMSPRTLHRRLASEGASYRSIAEDVRMDLAEELLALPVITVEEVATRVGYSEPASFTRAFHRSHGLPPVEFRRRALAAEAAGALPSHTR